MPFCFSPGYNSTKYIHLQNSARSYWGVHVLFHIAINVHLELKVKKSPKPQIVSCMFIVKSWSYRIFSCNCEKEWIHKALILLCSGQCLRRSPRGQIPKGKSVDSTQIQRYLQNDHSTCAPFSSAATENLLYTLQQSSWTNRHVYNHANNLRIFYWQDISRTWVWEGRHIRPSLTQGPFKEWVHITILLQRNYLPKNKSTWVVTSSSCLKTHTVARIVFWQSCFQQTLPKQWRQSVSGALARQQFLYGLNVYPKHPVLVQHVGVAVSDWWNMFLNPLGY